MITDEFISKIPSDFNLGAKYIFEEFFGFHSQSQSLVLHHDEYVEFYALLEAYFSSNKYDFKAIELDSSKSNNIGKIIGFYSVFSVDFDNRLTIDKVGETKSRFNLIFDNTFSYEFTDGDIDKVQSLINELRDIISKSELFTAEHKRRVLKRLERLQSELHKKVSDVDRFWGLIGDAGVVIGKFGKDAKPIVDRIKEIADIVWRTQANSEQLPSGSSIPFLSEGKEK